MNPRDPAAPLVPPPAEPVDQAQSSTTLALLYQGLITGVVRVRAGRQKIADAESFRRKTKSALHQVERDANIAGYHSEDVKDTHFAVVAFLDEVILNSNDPVRADWERGTLQQELFGQADAGLVFFEKLQDLLTRHDSGKLADILEVYLLCLLLGFQGRYSGGLHGELEAAAERARKRIERIRGRGSLISPHGELPPQPQQVEQVAPTRYSRFEIVTGIAALVTMILFVILKLNLNAASDRISMSLNR